MEWNRSQEKGSYRDECAGVLAQPAMPLESTAHCGEQDYCSLPASAEVHCYLVIAKDIDWHCLGKPLLRLGRRAPSEAS